MTPTPAPVARTHHHRTPFDALPLGELLLPCSTLVSLQLEIGSYGQDVKEHTNLAMFDPTSLIVRHLLRFT